MSSLLAQSWTDRVTPEAWAAAEQILRLLPPGLELDRFADLFALREHLRALGTDAADRAIDAMYDAARRFDVDKVFALARCLARGSGSRRAADQQLWAHLVAEEAELLP